MESASEVQLRPDEERANQCFEKHGVRITRERGRFELRGDLNAGQAAYLDPECKHLITPDVQQRVSSFFRGLDAQVVECLHAKGYGAVNLDDRLGFDASGVPSEQLRACIRDVFREYE